eukprot:symbB.v1.2.016998.t1/scaffold1313.1/size125722/2
MAEEVDQLLNLLQSSSNVARQQAEAQLEAWCQNPNFLTVMMSRTLQATSLPSRQLAASILSWRLPRAWPTLSETDARRLQAGLLECFLSCNELPVLKALGEACNALCQSIAVSHNTMWQELLGAIGQCLSQDALHRRAALEVLASLVRSMGARLHSHYPEIGTTLAACVKDVDLRVRIAALGVVGVAASSWCSSPEDVYPLMATFASATPRVSAKPRGDGKDALRIWTASISAAGKAKAWQKALHLLHDGQSKRLPPNVIANNAAVSACEKATQWPMAVALLESCDIQGWNGAISACSKAMAWRMALHLFGELDHRGLQRDAVNWGLRIACEAPRRWQDALASLAMMRQAALEANVLNFSALLRGCKDSSAWEAAVALLQEMFVKGPAPDVLAANTVIGAKPPWNIALALLEQMESKFLLPTTSTVNAVIQTLGQAGEWPMMLILMSQLRTRELSLDEVTYVNVLTALGRSKRRDIASQLMKEVLRSEPAWRHGRSGGNVFSAAVAAVTWEEALEVFNDMARCELRLQSREFNAAMFTASEGTWTASFHLYDLMTWHHLQPNVISLTTLLQARQEERAWDMALDLFWRSNIQPNVMSVAELSQSFTSSSWMQSVQLLNRAHAQRLADEGVQNLCLRLADSWSRCLAHHGALQTLLRKACNANQWAYACSSAFGETFAVQETLRQHLADAGPWEVAIQGVDLSDAKVFFPRSLDSWSQSLAFFHTFLHRSVRPDASASVSATSAAGRWREALLLREVTDVSDAMKHILQVLAETRHFDQLQGILEEEMSGVPMPRAWSAVLYKSYGELCRKQQWNDAVTLLSCLSTVQLEPTLLSQNLLLGAWQKTGLWSKILDSLDLELPRRGYLPDIFTYGSALAASRMGGWQRSLEQLANLQRQSLKLSEVALAAMVATQEKAYHWRLALHLSKDFREELSIIACSSAVGACENLGQWRHACDLLDYTSSLHLRQDVILINSAASAASAAENSAWSRTLAMLGPLEDRAGTSLALNAWGKGNAWPASLRLMDWAMVNEVQVDVPACSLVVTSCSRALHALGVLKLLQRFSDDLPSWHGAADATLEVAVSALGSSEREAPEVLVAALRALGRLVVELQSEALRTASLQLVCRVLPGCSSNPNVEACQIQALQLLRALAKSEPMLLSTQQGQGAVATTFAAAKDAAPSVDDLDEVSTTAVAARECLRALARANASHVLPVVLEAAQAASASADALDRAAAVHAVAFALCGAREAPGGWAVPLARALNDSAVWVRQAACEGAMLLAEELKPSTPTTQGLELLLDTLMKLLPHEPNLELLEKAAIAASAILQELSTDEAASFLPAAAPAIFQAMAKVSHALAGAANGDAAQVELREQALIGGAALAALAQALTSLASVTTDHFAPWAPEGAKSLTALAGAGPTWPRCDHKDSEAWRAACLSAVDGRAHDGTAPPAHQRLMPAPGKIKAVLQELLEQVCRTPTCRQARRKMLLDMLRLTPWEHVGSVLKAYVCLPDVWTGWHERGLAQPLAWASHEERFAGITSTCTKSSNLGAAGAGAVEQEDNFQQELEAYLDMMEEGAGRGTPQNTAVQGVGFTIDYLTLVVLPGFFRGSDSMGLKLLSTIVVESRGAPMLAAPVRPAVLAACLDAAGAVIASAWADRSFQSEKEELAAAAQSVLLDSHAPSEARASSHNFYARVALAQFEDFAPSLDTVMPPALEALAAPETGEVVKHGRSRAVRTGAHE